MADVFGMSALGQKRTWRPVLAMSALPPIANIRRPGYILPKQSVVVVDETRQRGLLPRRDPIAFDLRDAFPRFAERLVIEEEATSDCRPRPGHDHGVRGARLS